MSTVPTSGAFPFRATPAAVCWDKAACCWSPPTPIALLRCSAANGFWRICSAARLPCRRPTFRRSRKTRTRQRATSVRERMEQHRANPACAGCHKIMDPIGLALENFDGVGQWRNADSGLKIDASGQLVDGTRVDGPASLRKALLGPSGSVRRHHDRKIVDVRSGPRNEVLRHAGGTRRDAGCRRRSLPVLRPGVGNCEERAVSDENERSGYRVQKRRPESAD